MTTRFIATCLLAPTIVALMAFGSTAFAKQDSDDSGLAYKRYVVELLDPPLALYDGGELSVEDQNGPLRLAATAPQATGEARLDVRSPGSLAYLSFLEERRMEFMAEAYALLGHAPEVSHRYSNATNGLAMILSADEAAILAESPLVRSIAPDVVHKLDTYAGPEWLGAGVLWNGGAGYPAAGGEGVVIGNIDTGINWDHPSFDDSNYSYTNPFGEGLGLCSDPEVLCNDKIVGVYDFVEDNPATEEWVEENTKGKDNNGHGSHTAGIAAGVPVSLTINNSFSETISGVAPRAQIVSYRVCYMGEPSSSASEGCSGSAILEAIDQAIADGVDVINYSIGGDARDPWGGGTADRAFLGARSAGIFIASSAGNTGPRGGTITSPAMAPWVVAVANATHNVMPGNRIENFSGGSMPAPDPINGASWIGSTGKLQIVHAKDFGNALCGTGTPANFVPSCSNSASSTNPWAGERPFNGEIVVCDRGLYGRVEKGLNLELAGAGGYILANTAEFGASLRADNHCLPASHIDREDGDKLRAWLDEGSGHGAQISGISLTELDAAADELSFSSSRGPAGEPVQDTLKPNLIAPGTGIVAAGHASAESFLTLGGTSMASPHVAGSAALVKSVHNHWDANQLASAIELTATQETAKNEEFQPASTEESGAGRPQLGEAVNAGLYLEVLAGDFIGANPSAGGDPGALNLPGVVSARCKETCSFQREVTDLMGGGNWTATPVGFPAGTQVTVSPSSFLLGNGASQSLDISIDVRGNEILSDWVSGKIHLSAAGSSDLYLTVSAYSYGGDLPEEWTISTTQDSGWTEFGLTELVDLPGATFTAGGPVKAESRTGTLVEDPTDSDPYDGGEGVYTQWYELPEGALWLYAETLTSSAVDLDLFIGMDKNGNGFADDWEELCSSTTPQDLERCDLYNLPAGDYWILVQNWKGSNEGGDDATLLHAAVTQGGDLAAGGPGIVGAGDPFPVRVSWDNFNASPGETWLGAVGVGSNIATPNDVGVIPVQLSRTGVAAAETFALMNGKTHGLALASGGRHDRVFIDVPPGADSLTVTASGADDAQSNALTLELIRMDFADAMSNPPFASPVSGTVVESATGSGGTGPTATVSGGVQSGRWYAVLSNGSDQSLSVSLSADVAFLGDPIEFHRGLWYPPTRSGQGFDYNWGGTARALIWYTYEEDGQPAWYLGGAPASDGNIWTSELYRVTNDGESQRLVPVGDLSVTMLAPNDALFTYTLFGQSGTERVVPSAGQTCPDVNGSPGSYTGIWFRGVSGLGGASVLVNDATQTQIHYLFDGQGYPRWLYATDQANPLAPSMPIYQVDGYCPVCEYAGPGSVEVGTLERGFDSDLAGWWTLDYDFSAPLSGSVVRTDQIMKLTDTLGCE